MAKDVTRVAEVGSLSARAKMPIEICSRKSETEAEKSFCCGNKTSSVLGDEGLAGYKRRDQAKKGLGEDDGQSQFPTVLIGSINLKQISAF